MKRIERFRRGRLWLKGVAAVVLTGFLVTAFQDGSDVTARAQVGLGAQPLQLAPSYTVTGVNNPEPAERAQMGWLGIANAGDLNGDTADDILVPNYAGPGKIFIFSGVDGQLIRTLELPDAATSTEGSEGNFVYPAKLGDIASCPGVAVNQPCPAIGGQDGVAEILVGASGVDIPGAAPDMGRAYVFDGATGALLKKVQMPPTDLASEAAQFPEGKSFSFGRAVISPSSLYPASAPDAVKRGDIDGGGESDFIVGNPTFYEAGPTSNGSCDPGPCPGAGRAYFFRGEQVAGSAETILDDPLRVVKNPAAESDLEHERFGHAFIAVGDVGKCNSSPGAGASCPAGTTDPDGRPEVVVSAHRAESGGFDAGVVWLVDGATGAILRRYDHPEPQDGALFGYYTGTMSTAIGDVAGSDLPDIFAPAVGQAPSEIIGQGRGYIMDGDWTASTPLLASIDDPTPNRGENFGAPASGIGDVAGDSRNEVVVGVAGPLFGAGDDRGYTGQVLVVEPATGAVRLAFEDPDQQGGSGFGQGAVSLGDVNGDGLMDFAAEAGYWSGEAIREGKLYIFHSNAPPTPPPPPGDGGGGGAAQPGGDTDDTAREFEGCPPASAARNVFALSSGDDTRNGTPGDDLIFAGTGADVIDALAGDDCVDLGPGNDRGQGGPGDDLVVGGQGDDRSSGSSGNDRMRGDGGDDRLVGGRGNDSLFGQTGDDELLGGLGNDLMVGQAGNDRMVGSRGRDRLNGGRGNDRLFGESSADRINAGSGKDRVRGGSGNDVIRGDSGNDRLIGETGRDRIFGGLGNDLILAVDGQRDRIRCGVGFDRVVADRIDRVDRASCERVRRVRKKG